LERGEYGGGLHKVEQKESAKLPADILSVLNGSIKSERTLFDAE
jgi:hypothetical protein